MVQTMVATVFRALSSTIPPLPHTFARSQLRLSTHLSRPTSSLPSIPSLPTTPHSPTPLFLRPPTSTATLPELQKWRKWAHTLALSVGSKFSDADGGPESHLLCREITWLLEDAVEDYAKVREVIDGDLAMFYEVGSDKDCDLVRLRVDLDELYLLWKERIEKRRPFQYVVGCQHWRDLVLTVQEGVLIPRPETEMVVDMVEEVISKERQLGEGIWTDMGTGSGAIGIGIGRVLGDGGRVIATDVSPMAVAVAKFNVERYGLQTDGELQSEFITDILNKVKGSFHDVKIVADLAGIRRFVTGFRS